MRKLKSVKPPEIPGMGVLVDRKKKLKESRRHNVTYTDFPAPLTTVSLKQQPFTTVMWYAYFISLVTFTNIFVLFLVTVSAASTDGN